MLRSFVKHGSAKVFGWPPPRHDPPRETAWLDGVRGVAAFLVMMNHYSMEWLSRFSDAPFGAVVLSSQNPDKVWYREEGERLWELWRLPILRVLMCSGNAQVAIFFVLSGFVLSWSPLASVRANRYEKLAQSLGSSTIRRWFRLFLPCLVVSITFLIQRIVTSYQGIPGIFKEIWNFVSGSEAWANPFETARILPFMAVHPYNYVMWTIPFEFGGSIFVYVTLLGLGRIQSYRRRISATIFVSLYALVSSYWGYWLFGSGLALADYVHEAGGFKKLSQRTSTRSCYLWFLVLVVGLLLLGYTSPFEWYTTPGYTWTAYIPLPAEYRSHIGEGRFWWGWGGIFVVTSSCHLSFMRRFFELSINQHLGRISFMLYLIHILIDLAISQPLRRYLYSVLCLQEFSETYHGDIYITTPLLNVSIYCLVFFVSVPIVMSLAHFLEIYVDRPCTSFAKWFDEKLVSGFGDTKVAMEEEEQLLTSTHIMDVEMNDIGQRQ